MKPICISGLAVSTTILPNATVGVRYTDDYVGVQNYQEYLTYQDNTNHNQTVFVNTFLEHAPLEQLAHVLLPPGHGGHRRAYP